MILSLKDLKEYLQADKIALGINKRIPSVFQDDIWKFEIKLRFTEYFFNKKEQNFFFKLLAKCAVFFWKKECFKRCSEIPLNCIGPGLCIWHGFNIIINSHAKVGRNFGISANCNIGHRHGLVPIIGNNVTMCYGSKVIGGVKIGDNVTVGAGALVLHSIDESYVTVAGVPAKILSRKEPGKPLIRG